jgi:hypothetical protein
MALLQNPRVLLSVVFLPYSETTVASSKDDRWEIALFQ